MTPTEQTITCPRPHCDWERTGTTHDLLTAFRAHKLVDHGLPVLHWEPYQGGWRAFAKAPLE